MDAVARERAPRLVGARGESIELDERTFRMLWAAAEAAMDAGAAPSPPPAGLTTSEAAEVIGVSARTVERLADAGRIPCTREREGSARRFLLSDVVSYRDWRARRRDELESFRDEEALLGGYDGVPAELP